MSEMLRDHPDLAYYLRDLRFYYLERSAGGSKAIRSHMKKAREALGKALKSDPRISLCQPERLPVRRHFSRALDRGVSGPGETMIQALSRFEPLLRWGYGYDRMPGRLKETYAYAEILGPRGPVVSDDVVAGIVLLAPDSVYPSHSHEGVTESYIVLSGALSQNDAGVYVPGSMIFNPPEHSHRITVDRLEPCLLSYVWIGSPKALAEQKMRLKGRG